MSTAVVIVNFRAYDDLTRCLDSLYPHLLPTDEVVVIDYESNAEALARAVGDWPVTALPRSDNLGFAAGVNLGAARTRAPYLLLLNPDAVVDTPVVRGLESWLAEHPDVAVVGARVFNADGSVQPSARRFPDATTLFGGRSTWLTSRFPNNWFSRRSLSPTNSQEPRDVDWVSGACFMTRRDVFEQMDGFDEQFFLYWEDADFCRRVAGAGFRRMYVPYFSVRHVDGRSAERVLALAIRAFHRSAFRM